MQARNTIESEQPTEPDLSVVETRSSSRGPAEGSDGIGIDFLANLAHQLRSPLSSLRVWVDLLQDPATLQNPDGTKRLVEGIDRATSRLERQISDVLEVGYLQAGSLSIELGPVDAAEQIALAAAEADFAARSRRINIDLDLEDGNLTVQANEKRLRQIIDCFLSNAIRFSPVEGTVAISAHIRPRIAGTPGATTILEADETDGRTVYICISNTGPIIPGDLHSDIFLPFQRAVRKDGHGGGGSGLGLTIARGLVELHGGGLWVRSDATKGSDSGADFEFSMPAGPQERKVSQKRTAQSRRDLN